MARGDRQHGPRARTAGLIAAVVGAGFALTAFALVAGIALVGDPLSWPLVTVFAAGAGLTTAIAAVVAWTFSAPRPAARAEIVAQAEADAAADVAEASFEAQRRLLDDVRHELKTPITIVRGHLEVMDPSDSADVAAIRELGMAELDRMTRLIGDIDVLASVESGQMQIDDVHLPGLTARLLELVTVIPGHTWSVEQTTDAVIRGDRDRLLQAWLQLADNAAKYTPADSPIEVGCAAHSAAALLWVRDHGPGVAPAARHRVFRRFDRGTGRRSIGGSGLGLAIVDAIAKAHGGTCRIADTPGGGATFTLEIPIGTPAALPGPVRAGEVLLQREANG